LHELYRNLQTPAASQDTIAALVRHVVLTLFISCPSQVAYFLGQMAKDGQLVKVKASFKLGEKLKKVVKKPAVKKPAVKKPAAKKPAVKKPAAKKPAAAGKVVKKVGCCAGAGCWS
jgi:hypothetical protein